MPGDLYGTKWFTERDDFGDGVDAGAPRGCARRARGVWRCSGSIGSLDDGAPNRSSSAGLKDKLGTRSLPTAELELEGALAYPGRRSVTTGEGSGASRRC